jgi:hypothetical protein
MGADNRLFDGRRYVDDVFMIIINIAGQISANTLWEQFSKNCYYDGLILEETGRSPSIQFLESIVSIKNNNMSITYYNKNEQSIKTNGSVQFLNKQSAHSYTPLSTKKALMLTASLRVAAASDSRYNFLKSLELLEKEFSLAGFSKTAILRNRKRVTTRYDLYFPK